MYSPSAIATESWALSLLQMLDNRQGKPRKLSNRICHELVKKLQLNMPPSKAVVGFTVERRVLDILMAFESFAAGDAAKQFSI